MVAGREVYCVYHYGNQYAGCAVSGAVAGDPGFRRTGTDHRRAGVAGANGRDRGVERGREETLFPRHRSQRGSQYRRGFARWKPAISTGSLRRPRQKAIQPILFYRRKNDLLHTRQPRSRYLGDGSQKEIAVPASRFPLPVVSYAPLSKPRSRSRAIRADSNARRASSSVGSDSSGYRELG